MDGIGSAALIRQVFGADLVLVDYVGQMNALLDVAADLTLKSLYICDLGVSKKNKELFLDILGGLRRRHVRVTYFDHHDLDSDSMQRLLQMKVNVIHSTDECTAVLVHDKYKRRLPFGSTFIAACSAITDYMDDRPLASDLLQIYDRQFALISATVLTYNIVGHQKDDEYLLNLALQLAELRFPHEMPGAFDTARLQVERLAIVMDKVKRDHRKMRNLAHMEITDAGASGAVNFVLGLSGKKVGVAYRERADYNNYAVSIRGSRKCEVHLGRMVNTLAANMGGSGGGHDRACGALIPKNKMRSFLREFNGMLDQL